MIEEYGVFFDLDGVTIRLPQNPDSFNIKTKSGNKSYELVNLGEITVMKDIPLRELSFKSVLPNSPNYPWVLTKNDFNYPSFYLNKFREYKENKKPVRFIIIRQSSISNADFRTNMLVTIEDFGETENAGSLGEWEYSINLKEYREYGTKKLSIQQATTNSTDKPKIINTQPNRPTNKVTSKTYTVKSGDSLWAIAKSQLNDGSKYSNLYTLNKTDIDKRNKSTGNSKYTIYIGQVLQLV